MSEYCRSCDAGYEVDDPHATAALCDDCAGALTHLSRVARSWCDPDGDSTDDLRRAIRHAQEMGFDLAEIADTGAAACAAMGLSGEFRDIVSCIQPA